MNDTTNNLKPATPETGGDSASSLERMVRHYGESQSGQSQSLSSQKPGIIANLSSGKCGLQYLLGLFGVFQCRQSKNQPVDRIVRQYPYLQELYALWQSLGRPETGLWKDTMYVSHGVGCSCLNGVVMPNDPSSPTAPAETPERKGGVQ